MTGIKHEIEREIRRDWDMDDYLKAIVALTENGDARLAWALMGEAWDRFDFTDGHP